VPRYVFEVNVAGTVRVRAADEFEARKVVPTVLLLPGPDEIRVANESNAKMGWEGIITSVNFRVKGGLVNAIATMRCTCFKCRKSSRCRPCAPCAVRPRR
jgi:hypothetical protein